MKAIISNSNKSLRNVGERRDDANARAAKRKQYTSTAPAHSKFQFQLPQHAIRIAFFSRQQFNMHDLLAIERTDSCQNT